MNLSLTVSSTGSTLSESSLNDRSTTPDLVSSGSSSESSNTTISSYGSSASGTYFRMSNARESPYHITFGDSASQHTPPIVISPPRPEQLTDGSTTPSPSPVERMAQGLQTTLAQRLLSLVDSNGRPIRLVKRSVLKDITNIAKTRSSVPGDDECIEDAQCLVYRSAEEFLPTFVSTPPTCNAAYSESTIFGSSSRFGDMFSPDAPLPDSINLSRFAGSITRISGNVVTSLAAKYQRRYPDDYEDDGLAMGEQFEWEEEMRSFESRLGFYDK